jgi:hypothetical protein
MMTDQESNTILITGHVEKSLALEFKAILNEHGQISQAIRRFVRIFVMKSRDNREGKDIKILVDEAAHEAAKEVLGE